MADLVGTAQALLTALRSLGHTQTADRYEASFATTRWNISGADIASLHAAIAEATAGISAASPPQQVTPKRTQLPAALTLFEAFIEPIESSTEMIAALSELGRASNFEACLNALETLFVHALRYDPYRVDNTSRLGRQRTFSRLVTIAKYEDFVICAAQMTSEVPYSTPYQPIFNLYPYGLCIVVNTNRKVVRFVYTHSRGGQLRKPGYRILTGSPQGRHSSDNLVVWLKRMDLVRPQFEDDKSRLRDRVEAALSSTPGDLATRWASIRFDAQHPVPGPAWCDLSVAEVDSFLQVETPHKRQHWGLEAVLRDRFPMKVAKGAGEIRYHGYHLSPCCGGPSTGAELGRAVTLDLTLIQDVSVNQHSSEIPVVSSPLSVDFSLVGFIPTPMDCGHFFLEGARHSFEPIMRDDGTLSSRLLDYTEESLLDEYSTRFLNNDTDDDADDEEASEDVASSTNLEFDGASLRSLLEIAVSRKLAAMARRIWHIKPENLDGTNSIFEAVSRFADSQGRLRLYSIPFLHAALTPVSDMSPMQTVRVIRSSITSGMMPPSWACLEASSVGTPGKWFPVRAARLHPSGELAVPVMSDAGWCLRVVRDASLPSHGRLQTSSSPASWWTAAHLAPWASRPVGALPNSTQLLRRGVFIDSGRVCVVPAGFEASTSRASCAICCDEDIVSGEMCDCMPSLIELDREPVFALTHETLAAIQVKPPIKRRLVVEVPASSVSKPPVLLLSRGDVLKPCTAWLQVHAKAWSGGGEPAWPDAVRMLAQLAGQKLPDASYLLKTPSFVSGFVRHSAVYTLSGRYGQTIAWRAVLEMEEARSFDKVILPDSRCVRLLVVAPEELPYEVATGQHVPYALFEPSQNPSGSVAQQTWPCFDGRTGQMMLCSALEGALGWLPKEREFVQAVELRRRLLDNAPLPEPGGSAISEHQLRWLRLTTPIESARMRVHCFSKHSSGLEAWEPALGAVLEELELRNALPLVAPEAVVAGPISVDDPRKPLTDPRSTSLSGYRTDRRGNVGGFFWQCACGALSGARFALMTCHQCEQVVTETVAGATRWACECGAIVRARKKHEVCQECGTGLLPSQVRRTELARIRLTLPTAVVHPWRFLEVAALLGLTRDEFDSLLAKHGPGAVLRVAEAALAHAPLTALHLRMDQTQDAGVLKSLGRSLFALKRWLGQEQRPVLSLKHAPIMPARFLMCGFVPGAPLAVHGELLERYRDLRMAIEQAERLLSVSSKALQDSGEIALQDAMNRLYGQPGEPVRNVSTLADLVGRLWPLSRPGDLRVAAPQSMTLSLPEEPTHQLNHESFWIERGARTCLATRWLLPFAGLFEGVSHVPLSVDAKKSLEALGVVDADDLSVLGVRESLRSLWYTSSQPSKLLNLFDAKLPILLPKDSHAAKDNLNKRMEEIIPDSSPGSIIAKVLMAHILGGWWRARATPQYPLGWRLEVPSIQLPSPWIRAIPPLTSDAWLLWPGMSAFRNPVQWLTSDDPGGQLLANVVGHTPATAREPWWTRQLSQEHSPGPVNTPRADRQKHNQVIATLLQNPEFEGDTDSMVAITESLKPAHEAVILQGPITAWLREHRGQPSLSLSEPGRSKHAEHGDS